MKAIYQILEEPNSEGGYKLVSVCPTKFGTLPAINFVAEGSKERLLSIKAKLEAM